MSLDDLQKRTTKPVLGFDNPKVWIEANLTRDCSIGFCWVNPRSRMKPREEPFVVVAQFALWRWTVKSYRTIETVDFDKNRTGCWSAPAAQNSRGAFMCASSDVGCHPKIGT